MLKNVKHPLKPRKIPVQERSSASVEAILQATVQVLLDTGKEKLTTTRVALRAGVSVGTLYQYFPNKSALLQACLQKHMEGVCQAVEQVCRQYRSKGLLEMSTALITAYLDAKMSDVKESVALYAVSADVDGADIAKVTSARARSLIVELFASAQEGLTRDPDVITDVVRGALSGVTRNLLDAKFPELLLEPMRAELIVLVHAYLRVCTAVSI